jgi:hypothetical protein
MSITKSAVRDMVGGDVCLGYIIGSVIDDRRIGSGAVSHRVCIELTLNLPESQDGWSASFA